MNIGGELSVDLCTGLSDKCKVDVRMHRQTNKNNIETTTIILLMRLMFSFCSTGRCRDLCPAVPDQQDHHGIER